MRVNTEEHRNLLQARFGLTVRAEQYTIALAGNPNVGKSTIFNALTGLHQHTGNWPGKTVDNAQGSYKYKDRSFMLVDLPGTYSILAHTIEEQIARDFLCFAQPDATVVVLDATCLERNLNLALQILEITTQVVVCVNLMDEVRKKNMNIDVLSLERELGVPVVPTIARQGEGLAGLQEKIYQLATGALTTKPRQMVYSPEVEGAIKRLLPKMQDLTENSLNLRWVALRLLDGDGRFLESLSAFLNPEGRDAHNWRERSVCND